MADYQQIKLTRSGVPGAQPTSNDLELGELALNYADGKLYFKNDSNNIEQLNSTYNNSGRKIFVNEQDNHIGLNTISPEFLLDLGGSSAHTNNTLRLNQNDDGTAIRIGGSTAGDITLLRVDNADGETTDDYEGLSFPTTAEGFRIKYLGSNNHELGIFADNSGAEVQALIILQDGTIGMSKNTSFTPNAGVTLDVEDDFQITGSSPSLRLHKTPGDDTHDQTWLTLGTSNTENAFELQTRASDGTFKANDYRIIKNSSGALNHLWSIAGSEELRLDATGLGIGTTATEALTVNGNAYVSGTITANNTIQTTTGIDINSGGDISATDITATGNVISADPTEDTHLTTKNYVDSHPLTEAPGQVIEMLSSFCNGSTLTGRPKSDGSSRTFTWPNVTAGENMDTTYRVYGSEISYQPPANWNTLVFKYNCTTSDQSSHALFHVKAYIETGTGTNQFTEVTGFRSTGGYKDNSGRTTFQFNIQNNATTLANGQLLASDWTGERKLKLMFRTYSTGNLTAIHLTDHWDGGQTNMFSQPLLEVVAIA